MKDSEKFDTTPKKQCRRQKGFDDNQSEYKVRLVKNARDFVRRHRGLLKKSVVQVSIVNVKKIQHNAEK